VLNAAEAQQPLIITGTSTEVVGQTVTVGLNGEQYTGTVAGDGTWSVTVPQPALLGSALPDGTYTVTADVSDGYGNAAQEATQSLTVHELGSVIFSSAVASFHEQNSSENWAPSQMIDGIFTGPPDPNGGANGGKNGWSVFNFDTGQSEGAEALLTLKIYQNYYGNPGHVLGDFALDYTTAASPTLSSAQTAVSIQSASSLNGTTFSFPSPGELLANASRNSIGTDTYTITALVNASSPITGIFLDTLKNSSLPGGGPRRTIPQRQLRRIGVHVRRVPNSR
jgi:Bacterial Ig-like domain